MKYTLATAVVALSIGSAAIGQETYDEIISGGGLGNLSNMETHLAKVLEQNGVSRECMGKLTVNDATTINGIINRDESRREKERAIKVILDEKC